MVIAESKVELPAAKKRPICREVGPTMATTTLRSANSKLKADQRKSLLEALIVARVCDGEANSPCRIDLRCNEKDHMIVAKQTIPLATKPVHSPQGVTCKCTKGVATACTHQVRNPKTMIAA